MPINYTQIEDRYKTFTYKGVSYPDSNSHISGSNNYFTFFNSSGNKNYFLGKVYIGKINGFNYYFVMKSNTKVFDVVDNLIETSFDSMNQLQNDSLIQFLDPSEKLEVGLDGTYNIYSGEGCSFRVNNITNGRITDFIIDNGGTQYFYGNKPMIAITKYKLKNN